MFGDLDATAERLRAARVEPTPMELDRALMSARNRAVRSGARPTNGGFMRSKLAVISILAIGVLMSGTGATLAFQGSSGQGNAAGEEYVAPGEGESQGEDQSSEGPSGVQTLDDESAGDTEAGDETQAARQETATSDEGDELPFTGLAAMPIIAIGLALLATGLVLQRRNSRADT